MLHILPALCISDAGGSGAAPTILTATATEVTPIACGGGWTIDVGWTLDFFNDVGYYIRILDKDLVMIADGLLTSSSPELASPPDTGDPLFTGENHNAEYTVELRRVSDDALIDSMVTNELTVETGPAC
jgi:hypothetical protein